MGVFDPEDPGLKQGRNPAPGGPIGGGGGGGGGFGFGGGGGGLLAGTVTAGPGGEAAALRALLRKRLLGARGAPYQTPGAGPTAVPTGSEAISTVGGPPPPNNLSGLMSLMRPGAGRFDLRPAGGPSGTTDPGVIPPERRTGDTTDRSYNDPRVAPFVGLDLLIKFLQAGSLGPNPSGATLDAVRSEALGAADAARQRSELAAQSMDVDPATRASYALRTGLQGQSDVSRAMSDAVLKQLMAREGFGQDLLKQLIAGIQQQNVATSGRGSGGLDWGGLIEGLGRGAGAFLP